MKSTFGWTAIISFVFGVGIALAQDTQPAPDPQADKTQADKTKDTRRGRRGDRQKKRIDEGVKSGELTKKEAVVLKAKEADLKRDARKMKNDGDGMTKKEKAKVERRQDKLSEEIYKEKHDAQKKK